jgi:hypothetical protein
MKMKNHVKFLTAICVLLIMFACSTPKKTQEDNAVDAVFDEVSANDMVYTDNVKDEAVKEVFPFDMTDTAVKDVDSSDTSSACPQSQPKSTDQCAVISQKCQYGQECCCGKCYTSYICECQSSKTWGCYYTDACLPPVYCPDAEDAAIPDAKEDISVETDVKITKDKLVLDPSTLTFFGLPINSVRFAVSGYDPDAKVCVTIIWDFSNNGEYEGAHCDDFYPSFPYVIIIPDAKGQCGQWDYGSNIAMVKAEGCVDFDDFAPAGMDLVDVSVQVQSPMFTGTIIADNRTVKTPQPVSFGLAYITDIPENVYVQKSDELGLPAWLKVKKDGKEIWLFDRCDIPLCDKPSGVCGAALPTVLNITNNSYSGSVYLTWDGKIRTVDPVKNCLKSSPAETGNYTAEFCFGWQVQGYGAPATVVNPICKELDFTLPAEKVVYYANYGG